MDSSVVNLTVMPDPRCVGQALGLTVTLDSRRLDLTVMPDLICLGLTAMSDFNVLRYDKHDNSTNNRQRGQLCILVVRREKIKKKHKQLIIGGNPNIIYLHAQHHMEGDMTAHLVRHRMARFGHQKSSHAPL
jgi:hypothetical protein